MVLEMVLLADEIIFKKSRTLQMEEIQLRSLNLRKTESKEIQFLHIYLYLFLK